MDLSKAIIIQNTLIQNLNNCVNTATTYWYESCWSRIWEKAIGGLRN